DGLHISSEAEATAAPEGTAAPESTAAEVTPASTVELVPYTISTIGITAVMPKGWTEAAPGAFARNQGAGDVTGLFYQAAPIAANQLLASLLPRLGLTQPPQSTGTRQTAALTWTLYKVDIQAGGMTISVDMALAESGGKSYLVILQTDAAEYDALHQ